MALALTADSLVGTVAVTDYDWYTNLLAQRGLEEVNFWKPSATRAVRAPMFSPFLFKLRSPHSAICGFGYFARYSRLPDWLAWDTFETANGCSSLEEMRARVAGIRHRIRFHGRDVTYIGCVLVVQPTFFTRDNWVPAPADWPARTQVDKRYDLQVGEGARVWQACLAASESTVAVGEVGKYGKARLVAPRLGQGAFRVAVIDAYGRACAATGEHSLPALEAAHIRPFKDSGPHEVSNGVLLRADLHCLFDKGYLTVTRDYRLEISRRLKEEFDNGRTYYPLHGKQLEVPTSAVDRPSLDCIEWHNQRVFLA